MANDDIFSLQTLLLEILLLYMALKDVVGPYRRNFDAEIFIFIEKQ